MSLFVNPFTTIWNAGALEAGALAHFYVSGTSTAANVYTDDSLGTAHEWPVEADANGIFPAIFLDPAVAYKVIFTPAGGDPGSPLDNGTFDPIPNGTAPDLIFEEVSTAAYTVVTGDKGKIKTRTYAGAMTTTLPAAASAGNGWWTILVNDHATYDNTITVAGGGTINNTSSLTQPPNGRVQLVSDGDEYFAFPSGPSFPLIIGLRFEYLSIAFLTPATTNGAGTLTQAETATNKLNYLYRDFSNSATKYACQTIALPPSYNGEAIYAQVWWAVGSGSAGETLRFGVQGVCLDDGSALDTAYGTAGTVDDTVLVTSEIHKTGWFQFSPSSAGSTTMMALRVYRDSTFGTHADNARIIGVSLRVPLSDMNDA